MTVKFPNRSGQNPALTEMFDALHSRLPNANEGVTAAIKALADGYRDLITQKGRIERDVTATPGARIVKIARVARKMTPMFEALEAARGAVAQQSADLRAEVAKTYSPVNPPYWTCMRHQEIRSYLRGLPQAQRMAAVEAARKNVDLDTLTAVADAQSFLSGVAPEIQTMVRNEFIEARAPQQAAHLKALAEQDQIAQTFREHMLQSIADLVDLQRASEIEAVAREDAA